MIISDLFEFVQDVNPHQRSDNRLLQWVDELDREIYEYLISAYDLGGTDYEGILDYEPGQLDTTSETLIDDMTVYAEFLAHKVDYSNGEYARANNHAAVHNAALAAWKERFFRTHQDALKRNPQYIRGL